MQAITVSLTRSMSAIIMLHLFRHVVQLLPATKKSATGQRHRLELGLKRLHGKRNLWLPVVVMLCARAHFGFILCFLSHLIELFVNLTFEAVYLELFVTVAEPVFVVVEHFLESHDVLIVDLINQFVRHGGRVLLHANGLANHGCEGNVDRVEALQHGAVPVRERYCDAEAARKPQTLLEKEAGDVVRRGFAKAVDRDYGQASLDSQAHESLVANVHRLAVFAREQHLTLTAGQHLQREPSLGSASDVLLGCVHEAHAHDHFTENRRLEENGCAEHAPRFDGRHGFQLVTSTVEEWRHDTHGAMRVHCKKVALPLVELALHFHARGVALPEALGGAAVEV
mmetsp:Transcript_22863/g.64938  ORF Transcript_22863/g.64938 Transcript_22863/m.64938 type:complete len:340 (-) Transcript_22863:206-1225(-)